MKPGGIMLNEISQKEKDKYCTISLICTILKLNSDTENMFGDCQRQRVKGWPK